MTLGQMREAMTPEELISLACIHHDPKRGTAEANGQG